MNYESSVNTPKNSPSFEVLQKREGLTQYVFPHVLVNINFSQQEHRGAPELIYAVYDRDPSEASLDKPAYKIPGVDMEYVVACIQAMAEDMGEERFWVHPYNEDSLGAERRLEQWKKYFTVASAPDHGYYISL
jgi:hypothetical protein